MTQAREKFSFVIVGHVDHGKSTIVGRLLVDSGSLPEGKLEQVQEHCRRNARPFEYAFLIDALKDEQAQGITIDTARVFFKSERRDYIIMDAPGHIEFLKNMVTGAARAEAAFLVIDAHEGVKENSRRHGYLLGMLGIPSIVVLVNKMDLVGHSEEAFKRICAEYGGFLAGINVKPLRYIPVTGRGGDNIVTPSANMPWYTGGTMMQVLDGLEKEKPSDEKPFRMPLQDVYKFTNAGDDRRIIAGTVVSGTAAVGDTLIFYPSGKRSVIKNIEGFNAPARTSVHSGNHAGFVLEEQIYIKRGELAAKLGETPPRISSRLRASVFWLGKRPMTMMKDYFIKAGTARVKAHLSEIVRVMDASSLETVTGGKHIEQNEVAECIFSLNKDIAFDTTDLLTQTSRFVIVDEYDITGGGIVLENVSDTHERQRENVMLRNFKWRKSLLTPEERAERYNQKPALLIITGARNVGKKTLARHLEKLLVDSGKVAYFLGIANLLYGMDADLKEMGREESREEHMRRLAELSFVLMDAGIILVVTAIELGRADLEIVRTSVPQEQVTVVWLGNELTTDIECDIQLPEGQEPQKQAQELKTLLQDKGVIFRP